MIHPLAIVTTIIATGCGLVPACQPTTPALEPCAPGIEVTIDSDRNFPCDLDGSQTLNVRYNVHLTEDSFITICFDHGGEPDPDVDHAIEKLCLREDY